MFDKNWETKENLSQKMKRNPDSILVAVESDKVIGCVFIMEDGWTSFIWRLAVASEYQNKGIGSQLLEKAEESDIG